MRRIANVVESGHYLTLEILPNKNLKLIATPEFYEDYEDYDGDELNVMHDLLEDIRGNSGFSWVDPETIGALTEAPIITDEMDYSDETFDTYGTPVPYSDANVWWYPNYMVSDFIQVLYDKGEVVFTHAPVDKPKEARVKKLRKARRRRTTVGMHPLNYEKTLEALDKEVLKKIDNAMREIEGAYDLLRSYDLESGIIGGLCRKTLEHLDSFRQEVEEAGV